MFFHLPTAPIPRLTSSICNTAPRCIHSRYASVPYPDAGTVVHRYTALALRAKNTQFYGNDIIFPDVYTHI